MNQSIYTERENILPHHAEWLDGCGAVWGSGAVFSKSEALVYPYVCFGGPPVKYFQAGSSYHLFEGKYTHCPAGTEFCERVAEILGLDKPTFEVGISKTETTSHKFKVGDLVKIKNLYNDQTKETTGKIVKPTNPMRYHVETKEDGFYVFDEVDLELLENNNLSMTINAGLPNDDGMGITEKLFQSLAEKWHESNSILSLPDYMGITKEEYKMLVEQKTTIKGMAIEYERLGESEIAWLENNVGFENQGIPFKFFNYVYLESYADGSHRIEYQNGAHLKNGYTITKSPTEFLKYVAQQTGKEYRSEPDAGLRASMIHNSLDDGPSFEDIAKALGVDDDSWKLRHPSYPHKTYRILDSLDGIPLDTRFKLSEWIPPFLQRVLFIKKDEFETVYFCDIGKDGITVFDGVSNLMLSDLDGEWMRIV